MHDELHFSRRYTTLKDFHRHQYYEAYDLLYAELNDRFQNELCSPVIANTPQGCKW